MYESLIRLFKGVLVEDATRKPEITPAFSSFVKRSIQHGFIFAPEVVAEYDPTMLVTIANAVIKTIGLSGSQMNASFHKSWDKIFNATRCQLIAEQITHYFTTYGFEALGIYSKDSIYIPNEELDIPEITKDMPLVIIHGYTREQVMTKLLAVLSSGIALKTDTQKDLVNVAVSLHVTKEEISMVKNKEARIRLYDFIGNVPVEPVEFLRLVVYKLANETLLIKNDKLINLIKNADAFKVVPIFEMYDRENGFKSLAGIFNRYKPLFLAFKGENELMNHYINRLNKLANEHSFHVPMPDDYLNQITAKLCNGVVIDPEVLKEKLLKASLFRKARLAYALNFRTLEKQASIMYKIRNGTAYSTDFSFDHQSHAEVVLAEVMDSIVNDFKGLAGKKIYIPEHVVYALPSTEKQFTGDIPSGSFVEAKKDMIVGIYWENVDGERIDLDLSLTSLFEKIGWDARYRDEYKTILFSGDMTDASNGASEMFYISKNASGSFLLSVNSYNYSKDRPVPYSIFIGKEHRVDMPRNFMIDPNNVILHAKSGMDKPQKVLGLVVIKDNVTRFFFSEALIGNSRTTSRKKKYTQHALEYMKAFFTNPISLNSILEQAGAIIVSGKNEKEGCDIDLSPEVVTKETFLTLSKQ